MNQQTHNFGATYQEGIVTAVDAKTHKVRCKIPALEDLETYWLPVLVANAGSNQFYCLPDEGELVALLLDAYGENGCVLGAIYNEQDTTPVSNSDIWLHKFKNGTEISHNRKTGDIVVNTSGTVTVTAAQAVVNADSEINGNLQVNGAINATKAITSEKEVSAPKVKQGNTELGTHRHTSQGDGKPTTVPI
ncbi:phage baseplate assembly protein V [Actinobacillus equuli]|uniref:phage baseplate assembly protein V n=1 Tax=Actinobacillus equuli TaxID=718 RepID=UPI0024425C8C|nr:phage baseplate assembly protein V [Actinobacillus equuli]WGE52370.1 phage baseplate assembly protein V [Actinobacillus equuli subsp. haemolyticus]